MRTFKLTAYLCATALLSAISSCSSSPSTIYPNEASTYQSFAPDGIPFTVSDTAWAVDMYGNHRAVVEVSEAATAVKATLPWRRVDPRFENKKVVIFDTQSGKNIEDAFILSMDRESGEVVFNPASGAGTYLLYYMPYKFLVGWYDARYGEPWDHYIKDDYQADEKWLAEAKSSVATLPEAKVLRFESRSKFDFNTPMGVLATEQEVKELRDRNSNNPVIFIEDRTLPIKLKYDVPAKWAMNPIQDNFKGGAMRNEYYVWQLGLWAAHSEVDGVKLTFSDFKNGSSVIHANEFTCFNQEGTNWDGSELDFEVNIPSGNIQAMWCGVQIPEDAKSGEYTGTVMVTAHNAEPQTVHITIEVSREVLADKGDSDIWRFARLRWLNSQIGVDSLPTNLYTPLELTAKNTIEATGKVVKIHNNGLLASAKVNNKEIYSNKMLFIVETSQGSIALEGDDVTINKVTDGLVEWKSNYSKDGIEFTLTASMEYDGFIYYNIAVKSSNPVEVKEVKLVSDYSNYSSEYFMGINYKGGKRPSSFSWDWVGPQDSYWIGGALAGAHFEFRGGSYHGPLIQDYKPAATPNWSNEGKGRVDLTTIAKGSRVVASTGSFTLDDKGKEFEFAILLTPVKPVDTKHQFEQRYFHNLPTKFNEAAKEGANICNIHHARDLNPFINYPFVVQDSLIQFIKEQHSQDRKVKLYYTIRELTNRTSEIFALASLGNEIFSEGPGYGVPWHTEHLVDGYKAAWYTSLPGEISDAALVVTGFSRWINYYLEGLRWMYENYELDGIYMDDVAFDRTVLKRMRKIAEEYRPDALIDLHSNTWYSVGPANQYTDFFPYVDRLWFGESFKYDEMTPDEWFVTFSGIPFGQMSEMLQGGGNRFLGTVYGTTGRHSYSQYNPSYVWKLWEEFGIKDAKMVGYWDENRAVYCSDENVKATCFINNGETLIAVGNFGNTDTEVTLDIEFEKLGLEAHTAIIEAPEVKDFQSAAKYEVGEPISIKAKEGVLLHISGLR